jgi:hypothetical protein
MIVVMIAVAFQETVGYCIGYCVVWRVSKEL